MTILTTCCCCFELQVGVAVLGWLGAILCPLNIITIIIAFSSGHPINAFNVLQLLIMILHFAVAVCLIRATQCKNKRLLVPWLVITIVNIVLTDILFVILLTQVPHIAPIIVGALIGNGIGVYFWLCVYSYYQELDALV